MSLINSAAVPPAPQASTGPKLRSWTTPTISSTPAGAIGWTIRPSSLWPARATAASICSAPSRTSSGPSRPSSTPPASLLCRSPVGNRLQRHRPAELGGRRDRLLGIGDHLRCDQRQAVALEQLGHPPRRKPARPASELFADDRGGQPLGGSRELRHLTREASCASGRGARRGRARAPPPRGIHSPARALARS